MAANNRCFDIGVPPSLAGQKRGASSSGSPSGEAGGEGGFQPPDLSLRRMFVQPTGNPASDADVPVTRLKRKEQRTGFRQSGYDRSTILASARFRHLHEVQTAASVTIRRLIPTPGQRVNRIRAETDVADDVAKSCGRQVEG